MAGTGEIASAGVLAGFASEQEIEIASAGVLAGFASEQEVEISSVGVLAGYAAPNEVEIASLGVLVAYTFPADTLRNEFFPPYQISHGNLVSQKEVMPTTLIGAHLN